MHTSANGERLPSAPKGWPFGYIPNNQSSDAPDDSDSPEIDTSLQWINDFVVNKQQIPSKVRGFSFFS